jgi:hypothetical protein
MTALSRREFLRLSALGLLGATVSGATASRFAAAATPTPTIVPPASKSMRGLYALMARNDDAIPADVLESPMLAGVTLQLDWSILQPGEKDFSWEIITGALSRVATAGKKLAIRPLAGIGTPKWLYEKPGIKKFTFKPGSDLYHPLDFGTEVSLPYPWQKDFLDYWIAFIQAFGPPIDKEPALVRVAVSGPIYRHAETYLPHTFDVMADWTKAGYSLAAIQTAWQRTLDAYGSTFTHTPFTLDLNPLPDPTDPSGETANGIVPVAIGQHGLRKFPGRFFPSASDFSDTYPWLSPPLPGPTKRPALYTSYERNLDPIYQTLVNNAKNGQWGLTVSEGRLSKATDAVKATLARAKLLKPSYLEVPVAWAQDKNNADALRDLFSGSG